jgi:hypothetical protein
MLKRLKKQHSVDSFGAVSMTSEHSNASFISDTGSDHGSCGERSPNSPDGNTKNQLSLDQCQDKISIIFEQPEYDKESPYHNASINLAPLVFSLNMQLIFVLSKLLFFSANAFCPCVLETPPEPDKDCILLM